MEDDDTNGYVADLELGRDVVDERRKANDCVHGLHQDYLVEKLHPCLGVGDVDFLANDDRLDDNLARHEHDLPNERAVHSTDGDG